MAMAMHELRQLEGRQVCVALADGSRLDRCGLVAAARGPAKTMWLFVDGLDVFIHQGDVLAMWEAAPEPQPFAA
jgi:hypothetical protein